MVKKVIDVGGMTREEMLGRISVLSDEIDANERENEMMQEEITQLYKELDKERTDSIEVVKKEPSQ